MEKTRKSKVKLKMGGMVRAKTPGAIISDIVIVLLVGILAVICILPMWHILMSSISDGQTIYNFEGIALVPQGGATFVAYKELFEYRDGLIFRGYLNTIIYVVGTVGVGLVLNVLAGYVLSRNTKLSGAFSLICIFSLMFSGGQAPVYYVVHSLGLTNTYFSVIFTECTMGMYMIVGAMAFRSVPRETVEAAELDGAGHLRTMFTIMLPQCMSLFMITVLMTFVASWNSFIGAQLYNGRNEDIFPLQLVLLNLKERVEGWMNTSNPAYDRYATQFAGIIVAILPIMIIMPFFQKQIESGVISGAVKG